MKARICDRCGGKLPADDHQIVKCEYCATSFQMYEGPEVPEPQPASEFVAVWEPRSNCSVLVSSSCFTADYFAPHG